LILPGLIVFSFIVARLMQARLMQASQMMLGGAAAAVTIVRYPPARGHRLVPFSESSSLQHAIAPFSAE
jgi:hypothetical protein